TDPGGSYGCGVPCERGIAEIPPAVCSVAAVSWVSADDVFVGVEEQAAKKVESNAAASNMASIGAATASNAGARCWLLPVSERC
ncbi:MAG: hypothetical protein DYG96_14020, partial [Chlorobi bacterium CHB2]|nr:hypothetical protein [Chlorobi bacterium CHB2]